MYPMQLIAPDRFWMLKIQNSSSEEKDKASQTGSLNDKLLGQERLTIQISCLWHFFFLRWRMLDFNHSQLVGCYYMTYTYYLLHILIFFSCFSIHYAIDGYYMAHVTNLDHKKTIPTTKNFNMSLKINNT